MGLSEYEAQALLRLEKNVKKYEKQIYEQLQISLKSIQGELTSLYSKYAKNGKLTLAEMTKYNKYRTMEKQILSKLDPAIKENINTIKHLLPDQYDQSFFNYAWAMDMDVGVYLNWGVVNTKTTLEALQITNPKNIALKNALKNYNTESKKRLSNVLLNGLTRGDSYAKMIKEVKKQLNHIYSSAETIVRTEGQRAQNKAQDDAYLIAKQNGVEGNIVWDATLDNRTRPTHGAADGQKKNKDGFFIIGGYKCVCPLDPNLPAEESINCRCHERFEVEGYSPQLRRTREQGVIPYMTYSEWEKGAKIKKFPSSGSVSSATKKTERAKKEEQKRAPNTKKNVILANAPKQFAQIRKNNYIDGPVSAVLKTPEEMKHYEFIKSYIDKADFKQRVPMKEDIWRDLLDNGRLKNLYESGAGSGSTSKEARTRWESIIATNKDNAIQEWKSMKVKDSDKPKYGYVFDKKSAEDDPANGYGEVQMFYKKDRIKDRCTMTLGNSSDQQFAFVPDCPQKTIRDFATRRAKDVYRNLNEIIPDIINGYEYMELQIWGNVTMKDIDSVLVSKRLGNRFPIVKAVCDKWGVKYSEGGM